MRRCTRRLDRRARGSLRRKSSRRIVREIAHGFLDAAAAQRLNGRGERAREAFRAELILFAAADEQPTFGGGTLRAVDQRRAAESARDIAVAHELLHMAARRNVDFLGRAAQWAILEDR